MIVSWADLDNDQKQLVVAMFNVPDLRIGRTKEPYLCCSVDVFDEACGWNSDGTAVDESIERAELWDASAVVDETGHLKISGNSGPSGYKPFWTKVFPNDVRMRIYAKIGA